jgi:hypothetical protein
MGRPDHGPVVSPRDDFYRSQPDAVCGSEPDHFARDLVRSAVAAYRFATHGAPITARIAELRKEIARNSGNQPAVVDLLLSYQDREAMKERREERLREFVWERFPGPRVQSL